MIFIVVKFRTKREWTDRWLELVRPFTEATRNEPGNLWFDWSRNVDAQDRQPERRSGRVGLMSELDVS